MLEYALISATVVVAFAAVTQLGITDAWTQSLDQNRDGQYVTLDFSCPDTGSNCIDSDISALNTINQQLELH